VTAQAKDSAPDGKRRHEPNCRLIGPWKEYVAPPQPGKTGNYHLAQREEEDSTLGIKKLLSHSQFIAVGFGTDVSEQNMRKVHRGLDTKRLIREGKGGR